MGDMLLFKHTSDGACCALESRWLLSGASSSTAARHLVQIQTTIRPSSWGRTEHMSVWMESGEQLSHVDPWSFMFDTRLVAEGNG